MDVLIVTIVDALLLVAVSTAFVIALGGRTRLTLWDVQIALRAGTNLIWITAVLSALRLWLGAGTRPFPALPSPDATPLEKERLRFAAPERATAQVWFFAGVALLGSIVWIVPHLLHIRHVPDAGDPLFSAWRIARLAHQLVTDPRHLLDGNQFYPLPLTLTYSDATVLEGFVGAPFVLAGADPLIVSNVLMLAAFPACGLAFYYASWRLTGNPQAALIAALFGAWYPFHAEHYSHLELQWVMFVPLAIVASLRLLAGPSAAAGARLGAIVAAQWLASMYVGVMLMSFLAVFIPIVALAWRVRPSRGVLGAAATLTAIVLVALAALGIPYMKSRDSRGERAPGEVWLGSAEPQDYGKPHIRLVTYQSWGGRGHHGERELFPGTSTLVLAGVGMIPPLTGATIATIVAGAMTFDWSLGFRGLTYDDLYKRSVIHRGMRVPARFSVVVGAALALLGGFGARRLLTLARGRTLRSVICAALAVAVLVDLRLDPRLVPYFDTMPPIYSHVTSDMVLVELPRYHDFDYMYYSTSHWARMLGGYSGHIPFDGDVEAGLQGFPSRDALARLHRRGATHVTYNCALETRRRACDGVIKQLDANPDLELVAADTWQSAPVVLYRFK